LTSAVLSVVIANYNHGAYLREALKSLLDQTRQPDEIILVDDGSTDDSIAIITEVARDAPLRLIRHQHNVGAVASYREGLNASTGTYAYLGAADDRVRPGFFEHALGMLEQHPTAGFCASLSECIDEQSASMGVLASGAVSVTPRFFPPEETVAIASEFGYWALTNATVYRRSALDAVGGFRPDLAYLTDSFFTEAIAFKFGACFLPSVFASLRQTGSNLSHELKADLITRRRVELAVFDLMTGEFADIFPQGYAEQWYALQRFNADFDALAIQHKQDAQRAPSTTPARSLLHYATVDARLCILLSRNVRVWLRGRRRSKRAWASMRLLGLRDTDLYRQ